MTASVCERVQRAIVSGALDDAWRDHAEACSECGFFLRLSRSMSGAWPAPASGHESPLGAALSAALAAACAGGEPLLGRWRLERELGRGGQGEVFRAIDVEVGEPVAVKIVRLPGSGDESAREVALARRVVHSGICRVFHTERFGELRLIVMELVEGTTLAETRPRSRNQGLAWWRTLCEATAAAHTAGVLHLDLKPGNVLVRDGTHVALTDFGLSRAATTDTLARGGTPAYMAPEQRRGEAVDERTDVYALGLLGRYLLGKRAGRYERVIRRATAEAPADRYPDAGALVRALAPRRAASWIFVVASTLLTLLALVAVALVALLPPPGGPRAMWRTDLWGPDLIAREAWNVARNPSGRALPRVVAEPLSACAQHPAELVDGIAQYGSWEHGIAFPAAWDVCVGLASLAPTGICGERRPKARLCRQRKGQAHERLELTMAELDGTSIDRQGLGQIEDAVPCGDRTVTVDLDRAWPVFAVRQWIHEEKEAPSAFQIFVDVDAKWQLAYATRQNVEGTFRDKQATGFVGNSAPITSTFTPVTTSRIRLVFDSCTIPRGQGWLYELEVFAVPSRWRAWWRRLTD